MALPGAVAGAGAVAVVVALGRRPAVAEADRRMGTLQYVVVLATPVYADECISIALCDDDNRPHDRSEVAGYAVVLRLRAAAAAAAAVALAADVAHTAAAVAAAADRRLKVASMAGDEGAAHRVKRRPLVTTGDDAT